LLFYLEVCLEKNPFFAGQKINPAQKKCLSWLVFPKIEKVSQGFTT